MKALLTACAVAMVGAIVGLSAVTGSVNAASTPTQSPELSEPLSLRARIWSSTEQQVLQLHNQERSEQGLSALRGTNQLGKAAARRCKEIQSRFDHVRPDGSSWSTVLKEFRRINYRIAGENIAYGYSSAESVNSAWMGSSGHRANILRSSFTHAGVGHCTKNGTSYWVVLFTG